MRLRWVSQAKRAGFTLVEVLIVVTIIAILAAIVIPHYNKATDSAKVSAVLTELQTARRQILAYQVEHNGEFPTLAQMWTNLTTSTNVHGNANGDFGPYLERAPTNPFTGGAVCAADNSADWQYDDATGAIRAVVPTAKVTELNLSTMDVVAAP